MQRRALGSLARFVLQDVKAESQLGIRALSTAINQSSSIGSLMAKTQTSHTGSAAAMLQKTRWQSDDAYFNTVLYPEPEVEVGCPAPGFTAPAVVNGDIDSISLSDYKGKYVILFWYPKDFTFVCPTEIIAFSDRAKEFEALNCQLIAASTDTPEVHLAWIKTPRKRGGLGYMQIPIVADVTKEIAARYGVLKKDVGIALRGLFIITPEGIVEHITMNNFPVGRSVEEALRTLQAIQFVAEHGEVCPADWKPGSATMVADPEKSLDYFESAASSHEDDLVKESKLKKISTKREYDELLNSGKPVLIKYWAPWCGKCKQMAPFVEDLAAKYPGVTVASFDTTEDALEGLATELKVKSVPQFKFYKNGEEVLERIVGYKKQPLSDAVDKLSNL